MRDCVGWICFAGWVLCLAAVGRAEGPRLKLEYRPIKQIEVVESHSTRLPGAQVKEWVFFQVLPLETPRQQITMALDPAGQAGQTSAPASLPLLFIRQVLDAPQKDGELAYKVTYRGTLMQTKLVPLAAGESAPDVRPLAAHEREIYTACNQWYDYDSPAVKAWMDEAGLRRQNGESDLDFARRVFLSMRTTFRWQAQFGHNAKASEVVRDHAATCVGLSRTFACPLRAAGIPTRTLSVRMVPGNLEETDPKADDLLGHATSEFFIDGIGWIPADITHCVGERQDEQRALSAFGGDLGAFFILSDGDRGLTWTVDTVNFGRADKPGVSADFRKTFITKVQAEVPSALFGLAWTSTAVKKSESHEQYSIRVVPLVADEADPTGMPKTPGLPACFLVWRDETGWHIHSHVKPKEAAKKFKIDVTADGGAIEQYRVVGQEQAPAHARCPQFTEEYTTDQDSGVDFVASPETKAMRIDLQIDGKDSSSLVRIGRKGVYPHMMPCLLPAAVPASAPSPASQTRPAESK